MNLIPVQSPLCCLYERLVVDLRRDILLSMKATAFWIWLEEVGFPNVVLGLLNIDVVALSLIFQEAVGCLNCIESPLPPLFSLTGNIIQIPLTKSLMSPNDINYTSLYKNRSSALRRISYAVNEIYVKAFDDIIQKVSPNNPPPPVPPLPKENKHRPGVVQV
ncbi:uncharacterized protein LOC113333200 [Papaver somniferum]|uniref:uncharacterized protein LOC113333200 n=1 Tax=Papaver somniferum TaxID=3469 RepID=UPI000E6FB330|nr:uncharacterized protein LOC113333200 [Papaver somniferum]